MKKALLAGVLAVLVVSTNAQAQDDESYSPPSSESSGDSYAIESTGSNDSESSASSSSSDEEGGSMSTLGSGEADTSTFDSTVTALDGAGSDSGDSGGGE